MRKWTVARREDCVAFVTGGAKWKVYWVQCYGEVAKFASDRKSAEILRDALNAARKAKK